MATWRKAGLVALVTILALSPWAGAASLPVAPTVVAAPGAWLTQYATPVLATTASLGLQLRNEDIMRHDVVSEAYGPDGQPWCLDTPAGRCPLFWTPLINRDQVVPVEGVQNAPPGTYAFYCTIHAAMRGTLVIAA